MHKTVHDEQGSGDIFDLLDASVEPNKKRVRLHP
jgi:hypothetical protein